MGEICGNLTAMRMPRHSSNEIVHDASHRHVNVIGMQDRSRLHVLACRPLVATLVGLLLSNFGLISSNAPQYGVVNKFLLPLAVPLLLFTADMRWIFVRLLLL